MVLNREAVIFVPDGEKEEVALSRVTHLAIAAHQDDIEFMAYAPIAECFNREDAWFAGVVTADGAGSPRSGIYANYTDADMKAIRVREQKKAAYVGEYSVQILLGHTSAQIKDKRDAEIIAEYREIIRAMRPRYVYLHNLADKHDTHVATAMKALAALRSMEERELPQKVYGCEVWRNLDWLCDAEKVCLDCGAHPNLSRALSGVFDSQIEGGKRYDVAAEGRRAANATFSESHACDTYSALNYAMDLTPLVYDKRLDAGEFIRGSIRRFEEQVLEKIKAYTEDK